jgi:GrpB-like predicted nucleotidyltransferase (UPF0157 family)
VRRGFSAVELCPYNKKWARWFSRDRKLLQRILRGFDVKIEHVGSTSVAGLSAKPCIDISLGVCDAGVIPEIVAVLAKHGFVDQDFFAVADKGSGNNNAGGAGMPTGSSAGAPVIVPCIPKRKNRRGEYINFVHIATVGSPAWNRMICTRDYLRAFPAVRDEYDKHKHICAGACGGDLMAYTRAKDEFLTKMRNDALKYFGILRDEAKHAELNAIWEKIRKK